MRKITLVNSAQKRQKEKETEGRVLSLLKTEFPPEFDIRKAIRAQKIEKSEKYQKPQEDWTDWVSMLEKLGESIEGVYNAAPGLVFDALCFKIKNQSVAQYLSKGRERFSKIPTRYLISPELPKGESLDSHFQFLHYFLIYCELRVLLGVIDVGMEHDPRFLFKEVGIDWITNGDKALFHKLIQRDPIFSQSVTAILKIKFRFNFWSETENDLDILSIRTKPNNELREIRAFRRAIFLTSLYEKEALDSLSYKQICHILEESGTCLNPTEAMCKREIPRLLKATKSRFNESSQNTFFPLKEMKILKPLLNLVRQIRKEALRDVTLHRESKKRRDRSESGDKQRV